MKLPFHLSVLLTIPLFFSLAPATPSPVAGKGSSGQKPAGTSLGSSGGSSGADKGNSATSPADTPTAGTPMIQLRCIDQLMTIQCILEAHCTCRGVATGAKANCLWKGAEIFPRCEQLCKCYDAPGRPAAAPDGAGSGRGAGSAEAASGELGPSFTRRVRVGRAREAYRSLVLSGIELPASTPRMSFALPTPHLAKCAVHCVDQNEDMKAAGSKFIKNDSGGGGRRRDRSRHRRVVVERYNG